MSAGHQEGQELDISDQKKLIADLSIKSVDKLDSTSVRTISKFSREVVNMAKASAKVARDNIADNMVTIPCLYKMREEMLEIESQQEETQQNNGDSYQENPLHAATRRRLPSLAPSRGQNGVVRLAGEAKINGQTTV